MALPYYKRINVTSPKQRIYRINFSPMTEIKDGYKGFYCFENYWQSGKRYQGLENTKDIEEQIEWWKKQDKGRRRYPKGKDKKVKYAIFPDFENPLYYIESRKLVYVPEYYKLICKQPILKNLRNNFKKGQSYAIYDFDGPRLDDGKPTIKEVTLNFLKNKINDPKYPFGHGYIVAGAILGIKPKDYIC